MSKHILFLRSAHMASNTCCDDHMEHVILIRLPTIARGLEVGRAIISFWLAYWHSEQLRCDFDSIRQVAMNKCFSQQSPFDTTNPCWAWRVSITIIRWTKYHCRHVVKCECKNCIIVVREMRYSFPLKCISNEVQMQIKTNNFKRIPTWIAARHRPKTLYHPTFLN